MQSRVLLVAISVGIQARLPAVLTKIAQNPGISARTYQILTSPQDLSYCSGDDSSAFGKPNEAGIADAGQHR
jgi:hypothetical protein